MQQDSNMFGRYTDGREGDIFSHLLIETTSVMHSK